MSRVLLLWLLGLLCSAPLSAQDAIQRIYADQKQQVHVLLKDGKSLIVPGEHGQVGIDSVHITDDGQTAGWLVLYPDPDNSSPYAGTLVVWGGGRVVRRFWSDQTFWSWAFYAQGKQVAYHVGPTHGDAPHCELHEVGSGRLLASWDGDLEDANRPEWTKGLEH